MVMDQARCHACAFGQYSSTHRSPAQFGDELGGGTQQPQPHVPTPIGRCPLYHCSAPCRTFALCGRLGRMTKFAVCHRRINVTPATTAVATAAVARAGGLSTEQCAGYARPRTGPTSCTAQLRPRGALEHVAV